MPSSGERRATRESPDFPDAEDLTNSHRGRRTTAAPKVTIANCMCNCTVVRVTNVYLVAYNSHLPDSTECLNKRPKMGYDFRAPVAQGKRRAP